MNLLTRKAMQWREVAGVLTHLTVVIHSIDLYQIITLYTLNLLNVICQWYQYIWGEKDIAFYGELVSLQHSYNSTAS